MLDKHLFKLGTIAFLTVLIGSIWGCYFTEDDFVQGVIFRLIYIHVPAAFLSLSFYSLLTMFSIGYLIWRNKLLDNLAYASAYVGFAFTLVALLTGCLWGKPTWGTYWVWDARLTFELILGIIYLSYIYYRQTNPFKQSIKFNAAVLAIVGFIDVPLIHFSVNWWFTLHQGESIKLIGGSSAIHQSYLYPILICIIGYGLFGLYLMLLKVYALILRECSETKWLRNYILNNKGVSF